LHGSVSGAYQGKLYLFLPLGRYRYFSRFHGISCRPLLGNRFSEGNKGAVVLVKVF